MMAKKTKSSSRGAARRLAPIGLWISGAAILTGVALLIVKLLIFIGLYSLPDPKYVNWTLWICLGLAVMGPAIYALLDPQRVRDFLAGRRARHGSNAVIMLIAFVLILVSVNAIAYIRPAGPDWYDPDWTEDKVNSLAPETIDALAALPAGIRAIGFYTSRTSNESAETLFKNLQSNSDGKFEFEFIDPETNPGMAQQYNVQRDGTVILILEGRQELLTYVTEHEVMNALVRLMNPGQRTVYFLTGHGEGDITGAVEPSYTQAKSTLETKNYTVKTLNLAAQNSVPEDALSIIIARPTEPLTEQEIGLLDPYLAQGGSLVVLLEPTFTPDSGPDPLIDYLASSWGIRVNQDVVIDTYSNQVTYAFAAYYSSHAITEKLQNILSYYPSSRSLSVVSAPENVQTTVLIQTSEQSWGETNLVGLQNGELAPDEDSDTLGPLPLVAASENAATGGRVVVAGDADFASNTFFNEYANGDVLVNSIDWAAGQESMINLTVNQATPRTLKFITNTTMLLLAISFSFLIPALVAAGGVASWLVRRSRG
jgi:ABC-type uncharacterized transport system involved in gliding motility auxiliary subunit